MASSQAQAEITERRLRPLYDAIDNGQNKKALHIADKIIKKQEDLFCAKALKAIVCQRMGRQEEGNSLIDEVIKACPGDQATLQATTMYYRETGDEQKVVELYSRAAEQYPGNQDILTHLFMAFVRVANYQKQQQTALLLHKAFPDNGPYYCWRVMSIVMQAHRTNDGSLASTMFLPLAEKLMEKYAIDKKLDIEEEVKLYLMVLDKLGKPQKRLEVIKGELGHLIRKKEDRDWLELECYLSLEQWDDATLLLTELLLRNPDQWRHIELYITCQIQRYKESVREAKEEHERRKGGVGESGEDVWKGEGEKVEDEKEGGSDGGTKEGGKDDETNMLNTTESGQDRVIPRTPSPQPLLDARSLLESLRNKQSCRSGDHTPSSGSSTIHPLRGPFLGRLELVKQITRNGLQNIVELPSPSNLLLDYFSVFGTKSCCFEELRTYIEFFSPDELKRFMVLAETKVKECPINFNCAPEDVKYNLSILRRQISLVQLQRYCGYHRSISLEKKMELVRFCKHMYKEGMKLCKGIPDADAKPADFFAVLAAHLLMEVYVDTREWRVLWRAIQLLEHARTMKTTNPQVLLLLMRLYGFLGAAEGITAMFEGLTIKHIQMETLGYIPLRYLQSSGAFGFANQLYRSALRFYYSCAKETSEYIIQAYKNGMFQKILEFVNLRDKLTHSLSFACTLVDMNLLEVVTSIHSMEKAHQFFGRDWFSGLPSTGPALHEYCSSLVDSRDLTVYEDWSRSAASSVEASSLTKLENKLSSEVEILWLRVRVILVQCLKDSVLAMATAPPSTPHELEGEGAPEAVVVFNKKVTEFSKCLTHMAQHVGMLVLQQKRAHLLPLQTSPPCLGLRFLSSGHGPTLLAMFAAIERLALGKTDVEKPLKEVINSLRGIMSAIHSIPDELREVITKVVKGKPRETAQEQREEEGDREREREKEKREREVEEARGEGGGDRENGLQGESEERDNEGEKEKLHTSRGDGRETEGEEEEEKTKENGLQEGEEEEGEKEREQTEGAANKDRTEKDKGLDNKLSSSATATLLNSVPNLRVDMEQYSLFISVFSYIVLLSAVCVDIVRPVTSQSRKKKKKKRVSEEAGKEQEHPSVKDIVSFVEELSSLIHEISKPFKPIPSVDRQLINLKEELERCQLSFDESKDFELSMYPQVCKLVLQSYNTSMEDSQEVLNSKLTFLESLLHRLDGRLCTTVEK